MGQSMRTAARLPVSPSIALFRSHGCFSVDANCLAQSTQRAAKQLAYQIWVASSLDNLTNNHPDIWDSGKVLSDQIYASG